MHKHYLLVSLINSAGCWFGWRVGSGPAVLLSRQSRVVVGQTVASLKVNDFLIGLSECFTEKCKVLLFGAASSFSVKYKVIKPKHKKGYLNKLLCRWWTHMCHIWSCYFHLPSLRFVVTFVLQGKDTGEWGFPLWRLWFLKVSDQIVTGFDGKERKLIFPT